MGTNRFLHVSYNKCNPAREGDKVLPMKQINDPARGSQTAAIYNWPQAGCMYIGTMCLCKYWPRPEGGGKCMSLTQKA